MRSVAERCPLHPATMKIGRPRQGTKRRPTQSGKAQGDETERSIGLG
jgi:hypothetical protein